MHSQAVHCTYSIHFVAHCDAIHNYRDISTDHYTLTSFPGHWKGRGARRWGYYTHSAYMCVKIVLFDQLGHLLKIIMLTLGRWYHQEGWAFARGISCIAVLILPMMYYTILIWFLSSSPTTLPCTGRLAWSSHTVTQCQAHKITKAEAVRLWDSQALSLAMA